ncbi:MAG: 2-phospho-L-lactate transferase [Solirubrobacteraceae bacterium]|jgi:LPPG:FO 2-phospho-L-lactate transferase|nr:2-phospho-L-lactate transferase [Solirubrobacteraceae bacterium]
MGAPVVVLAGGTGGAKLARALDEALDDELVVIANTGDDAEIHGAHVSPDPDLIAFHLAGRIDARGWGLDGDSFTVMDALRELGSPDAWFALGDRDLAWCLERRRRLDAGESLTHAHAALVGSLGLRAHVLPMCDEPVRTRVLARGRWHGLQEFLIRERAEGPVDGVAYDGIEDARPTREVLDALAAARLIVIGPSNPVISIGPILAVPGLADALRAADAPVVAVSPIVGGQVLKGPTAAFMAWAGLPLGAAGIARAYAGIADVLVADEDRGVPEIPVHRADTRMDDAAGRRRAADAVLGAARMAGS